MTNRIKSVLFSMQDLHYRDFQASLLPTVNKDTIIGVRTPQLRSLASQLYKDPDTAVFLEDLPHRYYEENNLHCFLLEREKDPERCLTALERFLPFVDNWATCDSLRPSCLRNRPELLLSYVQRWIRSDHTYTVRFGIGILLSWYLDEYFIPDHLFLAASICSEEYYVNMMIAWYFATALAKQWDYTIPFLEKRRLSPWMHNKIIQKSIESRRITEDKKAYLRSLRCKNSRR